MSEARHDSTSSLQRKKPPWLKLDIPVPVPLPVPEEPPQPVQVQALGRREGLWSWGGMCWEHPCAWGPHQSWLREKQRMMAGHEAT